MKTLGNIIWFLVLGLVSFIAWCIAGIILVVTIIGIPFGIQCFKIATFVIWPIGKKITTDYAKHPIANVIWILFFGWDYALFYVIMGVFFYITIIGIPFGKQCMKLAELSLLPFGSYFK